MSRNLPMSLLLKAGRWSNSIRRVIAERNGARGKLKVIRQKLKKGVRGELKAAQELPRLFEYDAAEHLGTRARNVLDKVRPMEVTGKKLVRIGRNWDGGYVMVDDELRGVVAYSLGIGDDVSWDLSMAAFGTEIFQYDHSVSAPPSMHPLFRFSRIGIGTPRGEIFQSLETLLERNGHKNRQDLILKMDIEGSEWEVLSAIEDRTLRVFQQIVVELHGLVRLGEDAHYELVVSCLDRLNKDHQCVHVHANNYGRIGLLGNTMIPDTLEVTYLRRSGNHFEPCLRDFPTELDRPNNAGAPDIYLGRVGFHGD